MKTLALAIAYPKTDKVMLQMDSRGETKLVRGSSTVCRRPQGEVFQGELDYEL